MRISSVVGVLVALAMTLAILLARPPGARADVASEVYQDAKGIIEELLTAEITRKLVPQIVCRAGRQELEGATACEAQPGGSAEPATVCFAVGGQIIELRLKLLEFFPATLQAIYSRRFAALKSTVVSETIDVAADTFYDSMVSRLDDIERTRRAARDPAIQMAVDYANEIAPSSDTIFLALQDEVLGGCLQAVTSKLEAGMGSTVSRLDQQCSPSPPEGAMACELAQSLRFALRGKPAEAEARIRRAIALALASALLRQPALVAAGVSPARLKELADEVMGLVAALEAGPVELDKVFAAFAARMSARLGVPPATIDPLIAQSREAFLRVAARLRALVGGPVKLSLSTLVSDVTEVLEGASSLCQTAAALPGGAAAAGGPPSPCQLLGEIKERIGTASLVWPAVTAASSGDLRGVAHLVISGLFRRTTDSSRCDPTSQDESCKLELYRSFVDSLVMYMLDVAQGDTSTSVRTVFRQAAAEVVHLISPGGGVDRGGAVLLRYPELVLRATWSSGYLDVGEGRLRYAAGLNLLRLRQVLVYNERYYASMQLSLLDPLAPLAELALRPDRDGGSGGERIAYDDSYRLVANLVAPRFELTTALPWLSSHLALAAGVGLRLAAPTERVLGGGAAPAVQYHFLWDDKDHWDEFIEFGFALKYLL